jgi:phage FluMu protein Com
MTADVPTHLDGNAAAGMLRELFAADPTTATGRCAGCGKTGVFAEARVYMDAPGMVARCQDCDSVLLRVVTTPSDTYLDLRGLTFLRFPNA